MGKHFYINGCSHSSGAELPGDNGSGLAYDESWTNQLAKSLGAKNIVNEAAPGNSNQFIIQKTIDYVTNNLNEDLFVIVGFTGPDRMYVKHPAYEKNKPYLFSVPQFFNFQLFVTCGLQGENEGAFTKNY